MDADPPPHGVKVARRNTADRTDVEEDRLARTINTLEIEILKQRSGPTIRIECFCDIACNVLAEAR